jgi:predicted RNase H-like nuclease (RuvC/YqgF family)
MPEEPIFNDSPSDYAALLRRVRDAENLKLEINQLQIKIRNHESKLSQMEPYVQSLEQAVAERDAQIEELRAASGTKNIMSALKARDETIARLQQALQNKHRELEEIKTKPRR